MFDIVLGYGAEKALSKAGRNMLEAYRNRLNRRVARFFNYLSVEYENITNDSLAQLQGYLESDEGEELLADYAEVITRTSSKRASMVLVLLYCNDRDLSLSEIDVAILVRALEAIDDTTIDVFLNCVDIDVDPLNTSPYSRVSVNGSNVHKVDVNGWGQAGASIYINDLIQRRLLLPDPMAGGPSPEEGDWAVWFGVSSKSMKFARAFRKAEAMIDAVGSN